MYVVISTVKRNNRNESNQSRTPSIDCAVAWYQTSLPTEEQTMAAWNHATTTNGVLESLQANNTTQELTADSRVKAAHCGDGSIYFNLLTW